MSIWNLIERILLNEEKQYRGDSGIPFKALSDLIHGRSGPNSPPGILGRPPKPEGEAFDCRYKFDPTIWGKWFPSMSTALRVASTSGNQHAGAPQGATVMKKNYGGRISNAPGKPRSDFEALPSAMDRYDVLMRAEITTETVPDKKTQKMKTVQRGVLLRMAYAPSIGRTEERAARLQAMMDGKAPPPLARRPQPHRPEPTRQDLDKWDGQRIAALGRQQRLGHAADVEDGAIARWERQNQERAAKGLPPLPKPIPDTSDED